MAKILLYIIKSVPGWIVVCIIPFINLIRKIKNKAPVPKEKFCQFDYQNDSSKLIMIHGVSVGEVLSLENLIREIKKQFPSYKLVITTGTLTGQQLAQKKYGVFADCITYFPLDFYKNTKKFLEKINPSVILIAETELWPNFCFCAYEKNIPLYLINARISDKSYPSYLKIKEFTKLILECFSGVFCQSEIDKKRFIALGAKKDSTLVMKNLKFEIEKKECDIDLKKGDSKLLIAASTHKGEEEIVVRTYKKLKEKVSNLKLLLAPRHLTRVESVVKILNNNSLNFGYRTKNDDFSTKDVLLLDTLGELSKTYKLCDIAFIGGSFNKTGGHNPLEAAIFSKPTVSGPCIKNFRDIYSILENDGASFVVKNEKELYNTLEKLFLDEAFYSNSQQNCKKCFSNQQGALKFVVNELKKIIN